MTDGRHGQAFMTGFIGGTLLGAAAGVLFAPQISAALKQIRRELTDAATEAGDAATGAYRDVAARAGEAAEELQDKGRGAYGKVLSVMARGAEEVEGRASEAQAELDKIAKAATRRS